MALISFDPAATYYDATRGYPSEVATRIAQSIIEAAQATPQTTFLEVGVGTGRIALPVAVRGHTYTGVDISEKMLQQLLTKAQDSGWQTVDSPVQEWSDVQDVDMHTPVRGYQLHHQQPPASLRLLLSDITSLPFGDNSFDCVIAVHIFHLVDAWQAALSEVCRVVRPGGMLLHCWDGYTETSPTQVIHTKWREIVAELGGNANRIGATGTHIEQWLQEKNFTIEKMQPFQWTHTVIPREAVELLAKRYWSSTWSVPDDLFTTSIERLWTWAHEYYRETIDHEHIQERQFFIVKVQV